MAGGPPGMPENDKITSWGSGTLSDFGQLTIADFEKLGVSVSQPASAPDFLRQFKWAFPHHDSHRRAPLHDSEKPLILSVDDDEVNHLVIKNNLGKEYRIVEAMDGFEALEYLRSDKERPVCVLLDIMMPGMTGLEVVKEIRETLKLSHTVLPVVILSARAPMEQTLQESLQNGATDFMCKPFSSQTLSAKVNIYPQVRKDCLALYGKILQYRRRVYRRIHECVDDKDSKDEERELERAKEEILRLKDEMELTGQLGDEEAESLRQELATAEEEAGKLRDEVIQLRENSAACVASLEKELAETRKELHGARQSASRLEAELARCRAEAELARGAAPPADQQLAEDCRRLRQEVVSAKAEAERQVDRANKEAEAARAELERLRAELAASRRGHDLVEAAAPAASSAHGDIPRSDDMLQREIRWLKSEREAYDRTVADLSRQVAEGRAEALCQRFRADAREREIAFLWEEIGSEVALATEGMLPEMLDHLSAA